MRAIIKIILLVASLNVVAAPINDDTQKFDFRAINVSQVVQLIYSEALKDPYVIDPEVLTDPRLVSFRYDTDKGDVRVFITNFFDSIGLVINRRAGVDYISRKPPKEVLQDDAEIFVYRPMYRDGSYLTDILSPLFKGSFSSKKTIHALPGDMSPQKAVPVGSAAATIDRKSDTLVFVGTATEIGRLKKILPQVDFALGDVIVRGVLYEVQTNNNDGSAFGLALNLLGGKVTAGLGSVADIASNFLRLKNQSIDAVLSNLSGDNRFKVVSTPTLRVVSGGSGRFTVGQDVPVLGAVTYSGNGGAPIQSVEYRSSGVIFDLQPVVHDSTVDLTVMQQVSNFVSTDTGVNTSPTLIKRELKTSLTVTDNELIVLGGLAENKESDSRNGMSFLPSFFHTKMSNKTKTEILLILQLTKI